MAGFDFPRKNTVRRQWDTPVLEALSKHWCTKFFYCGLPGPKAIDIWLWKSMIDRVVAFQTLSDIGDPRREVIDLARELSMLDIPHVVYCGPLEEVVLRRVDYDGKEFKLDELVTLYNLDFCNCITGSVKTKGGLQRLRFDALREIAAFQRDLFRQYGATRFVMLLTVQDTFHANHVNARFKDPDLPEATRRFVQKAGQPVSFDRDGVLHRSTDLLKAFVFTCLSDYLRGQNIMSVFLPAVAYTGRTNNSPMLHFVVICEMGLQASPGGSRQSAQDFLGLATIKATENRIVPNAKWNKGLRIEDNSAAFLRYAAIIP